jgi:mannose-6-phosphate isomerase-like protein (cupin superfamily)
MTGDSLIDSYAMKRRDFFKLSPAAAVITATGLSGDANAAELRKEILVNAGSDRDNDPITFLDATFNVKISGKDTEGRCVVFDTIRHKKVGPAFHLHTDCDEWFFVRDGEFKFKVGDKILYLKSGDSLMVPRETPHAFVKTSEGDARLIVMHQPAVKMEEYFRVTSKQPNQSSEARKRIAEQSYGMQFLGPPLTAE